MLVSDQITSFKSYWTLRKFEETKTSGPAPRLPSRLHLSLWPVVYVRTDVPSLLHDLFYRPQTIVPDGHFATNPRALAFDKALTTVKFVGSDRIRALDDTFSNSAHFLNDGNGAFDARYICAGK